MARRLILLEGASPGPLAAALDAPARALGATLARAADAEALAALAGAAGADALVVVLAPDLPRPLRVARQVAGAAPEARFVFVLDPAREAAFRREAAYGAPAGGRWSVTTDVADLPRLLEAELAAAGQQHRLRTTLDRMRLRLATPAPVDSGEYRRLVASDRYLASVLRHAHDAIVSVDAGGRVLSWNDGAERLFGLDAAAAQRLRLQDLFRDPAAAAAAIRAALDGPVRPAALEIERDGAVRQVEADLGPLRDDAAAAQGVVAILRDVTERLRAEQELRESSRQKDEFLAMLAHELRNPLAPIRNATQILQLSTGLDERARRATAVIARQAEHMTALIDDLLDVARVTRGAVVLQREPLDLAEVAADAIEQARGLMEHKRQQFAVHRRAAALHVLGDRKRLTQVLANLLVNAAKYTPEGGRIDLDLDADPAWVHARVRDTGIGMAPSLVERVFDLFVQAERSPDRAEGGLGVGLALVRSLVAMHGGTVAASSPGPGLGSCFSLRLPRVEAAAAEAAAEASPATPPAARPLRLVIVDDNEDAAQTLGVLLRAQGHDVTVHTDPRAVLEAAGAAPDAYVLDIGMPHVDGYDLARRLRARHGPGPRLVALTGYGQAGDLERARAAGFDAHYVKPLDAARLAELLAGIDPVGHPAAEGAGRAGTGR